MGHGGENTERALSARDVLNNEEMLGKEETGRSSKQCLQDLNGRHREHGGFEEPV